MSFVPNNWEPMRLTDCLFGLTEREYKRLQQSWAHYFAQDIFPKIDESPYAVLYSEKDSRPNTPVNVQIGALILKELRHMSDEEVMDSLFFDMRMQYALHTTSWDEQPMSDRTLSRFRARCLQYEEETGVDLLGQTIRSLSKEIASLMHIDSTLKRMDSMMVEANIKHMSRLELLYVSLQRVLKKETAIPESLRSYLDASHEHEFLYHLRSETIEEKSQQLFSDIALLQQQTAQPNSTEWQQLVRVLDEQTVIENGQRRFRTKKDSRLPGPCLQSPIDPEVTYRHKRGSNHIGYIANFIESAGENGTIIEDYAFESNIHSDSQFLKETIETISGPNSAITLVTDGGYSGKENTQIAKAKGVTLITTNLTGKGTPDFYADTIFTEDGKNILCCPNGYAPIDSTYVDKQESVRIHMKPHDCAQCPHSQLCRPAQGKRHFTKTISHSMKERALQTRFRSTETFKAFAHFRNGVEAIPSLMRRKYYVDTMPVHGRLRSKLYFGFKIAALNFTRFCRYKQNPFLRANIAKNP